MSVGGVSGSSLIPALLFILPMTLIPSVSDPETPLIPWWHCAQGPSCRLPCCAAPRPANLWPCLGCYWCHPAPSSPITFLFFFARSHCFLSLSLSLSHFALRLSPGSWWNSQLAPSERFCSLCCIKSQCPFSLRARTLQICHRALPPFNQKLNGRAAEEVEINAAQRAIRTKQPRAHRLSIWRMAH